MRHIRGNIKRRETVEQEREREINMLKKTAKQGNKEAQRCLGVCFLVGEGVRKNEKASPLPPDPPSPS